MIIEIIANLVFVFLLATFAMMALPFKNCKHCKGTGLRGGGCCAHCLGSGKVSMFK